MNLLRINQYLAQCGVASRRGAEKLILAGEVVVNGEKAHSLSMQIEASQDEVKVRGKLVKIGKNQSETWAFHKPKDCLCTRSDPQGRKTIFDYLAHLPPPYQAVGRLDQDSEGLLLITRNGHLAEKLMHPRGEITKIYHVLATGEWKDSFADKLKTGVRMKEGGQGKAKVLEYEKLSAKKHRLLLELKRGKKREIRYSLAALNLKVYELRRLSIDFLKLGCLPLGKSRPLEEGEEKKLINLLKKNKSSAKTKS
ncbi:MAG: rRNA pseudouridine synthase [Planctomycetes bacterium]|nr:rRNA pseudouridine synthase [Planctomycetota bacterium]